MSVKTILRTLNLLVVPILSLWFATHLPKWGIKAPDGDDGAKVVGGLLASLVMLLIELVLTQGPKMSTRLRRWLDPRSAFEGIWLQRMLIGQKNNNLGVFSIDYETEADTYSVHGHAYSADRRRMAQWDSTHLFMDAAHLKTSYEWEGKWFDYSDQPVDAETIDSTARSEQSNASRDSEAVDKSGITELRLRKPPGSAMPASGDGHVLHLKERTRLEFGLQRVTDKLLEDLGLQFSERDLRLNARDEESQLVVAVLHQGPWNAIGHAASDARRPHLGSEQARLQGITSDDRQTT